MSFLYFAIYGFFVGVVAKSLFYTEDKGGIIFTIGLGILGSIISGVILSYFNISLTKGISFYGLIPAVLGSLILLSAYRFIRSLFFKP